MRFKQARGFTHRTRHVTLNGYSWTALETGWPAGGSEFQACDARRSTLDARRCRLRRFDPTANVPFCGERRLRDRQTDRQS